MGRKLNRKDILTYSVISLLIGLVLGGIMDSLINEKPIDRVLFLSFDYLLASLGIFIFSTEWRGKRMKLGDLIPISALLLLLSVWLILSDGILPVVRYSSMVLAISSAIVLLYIRKEGALVSLGGLFLFLVASTYYSLYVLG